MLNFNVGILGHVDSGKTTLAQTLSTVASTAAFDKNPQSKERGITLDLGFSSFSSPEDGIQYTLVDCPGHASLIKTIIGGAQIIDLMILVVDITKGMQTQTAECLVIGQITCRKMIVVLNKIDQINPSVKREKSVEKMTKKMAATLASTIFKDSPIVAVSAKDNIGLENLLNVLKSSTYRPERNPGGGFVFSVDHCFGIKGQGTVLTGTIIQGSVKIGDSVEISSLKEVRKVKSIQMFKKPVDEANQGDRIGLCVTQFDANLLERGLVSLPGYLPTVFGAIVNVRRIGYFKGDINSKAKFHISLGHETVLSTVTFLDTDAKASDFDFEMEFKINQELPETRSTFALLEFERPIVVVPGCKVLGSKLDSDINKNLCRLAFEGNLVHSFKNKDYHQKELKDLKIFKVKQKKGVCERLANDHEVIAKNMFKKETNINVFAGLVVTLSTGDVGTIDGSFGQSGKFKIRLKDEISNNAKEKLLSKGKKGDKVAVVDPVEVILDFKKYVFSDKMVQ